MQCVLIIGYHHLGTTYWSRVQGSSSPRRMSGTGGCVSIYVGNSVRGGWLSLKIREWIRLLTSSENTVAYIFNSLPFPGLLGPTCCLKVSVSNYKPMLHIIPEERRPQLRSIIAFASLHCRLVGALLATPFWWGTGNHSTLLIFIFYWCRDNFNLPLVGASNCKI